MEGSEATTASTVMSLVVHLFTYFSRLLLKAEISDSSPKYSSTLLVYEWAALMNHLERITAASTGGTLKQLEV